MDHTDLNWPGLGWAELSSLINGHDSVSLSGSQLTPLSHLALLHSGLRVLSHFLRLRGSLLNLFPQSLPCCVLILLLLVGVLTKCVCSALSRVCYQQARGLVWSPRHYGDTDCDGRHYISILIYLVLFQCWMNISVCFIFVFLGL